MYDSRRNAGLIVGYRDRNLRNTLYQRFEHGVQPGMGDTDRCSLQQLQLWRPFYDDGIFRNRAELMRIDLVADRKHQLRLLIFGHSSYDRPEDIHLAV